MCITMIILLKKGNRPLIHRVRHNRHKQGLNLTLEKLSADYRR